MPVVCEAVLVWLAFITLVMAFLKGATLSRVVRGRSVLQDDAATGRLPLAHLEEMARLIGHSL
jgi:hypothetical protein